MWLYVITIYVIGMICSHYIYKYTCNEMGVTTIDDLKHMCTSQSDFDALSRLEGHDGMIDLSIFLLSVFWPISLMIVIIKLFINE